MAPATVRRGIAPWVARAFLMVTLDLEQQTPTVQLLAPDFGAGRALDLWLANESVRERFLEAIRAELEALAEEAVA